MHDDVKLLYTECFEIVKKNTKITKSLFDKDSLNYREKLWYNISPAFYVIGSKKTKSFFDEVAKKQGFKKLLSYITPNKNAFVKNIFKDNPKMERLQWWVNFVNPEQEKNMGCHFSHVLAAMDMIDNNYTHAFIFEDDCQFKYDVTDNFLSKFGKYINENIDNVPFLNLGSSSSFHKEYENYKITKSPSSLTHSYIMNLECAKKLVDSINLDIVKPDPVNYQFNREQFYRAGADDFFFSFIESYVMNPAITFQQYIGTNQERMT